MSAAAQMLETYPQDLGGVDREALVACIEACLECAQTCTACADSGAGTIPCVWANCTAASNTSFWE